MKSIIVSLPRTGSTYYAHCLNDLSNLESPTVYLGEMFSNKNMGNYAFVKNKLRHILGPTKKSRPKWSPTYINCYHTYCEWLKQAENDWTIKIFPDYFRLVNINILVELLSSPDIYKVFLYRSDVEDWLLSYIISNETNIFNAWNNDQHIYKNKQLDYNNLKSFGKMTKEIEKQLCFKETYFYSIFKSFKWDKIISYEELTFTYKDFIDLYPEHILKKYYNDLNTTKKLLTKKEKQEKLIGYDQFYADFLSVCEEYDLDLYRKYS